MPDIVGYRAKFGVVIPSTNTVVEHDLNTVGPRGITFHVARMFIEAPGLDSDDAFTDVVAQVRSSMEIAVRDVLTCEPDHLIVGVTVETLWGGEEGSQEFEDRLRSRIGHLGITTGAAALRQGLERLGVRRLAVLTPYQPVADVEVRRFFTDCGFEVVRLVGLSCPSATAIAAVSPTELISVLRDLDGPDIDAIVQVGTNLSMLRLADEAERWLGKPVLAVNAASLWHALRSSGFDDRFHGYGVLLREL